MYNFNCQQLLILMSIIAFHKFLVLVKIKHIFDRVQSSEVI